MKKKSLLLLVIGVSISPVIFAAAMPGEMRGENMRSVPTTGVACGGWNTASLKPMGESMVRGAIPSQNSDIPTESAALAPAPIRGPGSQQGGMVAPGQMTAPVQPQYSPAQFAPAQPQQMPPQGQAPAQFRPNSF